MNRRSFFMGLVPAACLRSSDPEDLDVTIRRAKNGAFYVWYALRDGTFHVTPCDTMTAALAVARNVLQRDTA
jgi:hypothetical protein